MSPAPERSMSPDTRLTQHPSANRSNCNPRTDAATADLAKNSRRRADPPLAIRTRPAAPARARAASPANNNPRREPTSITTLSPG